MKILYVINALTFGGAQKIVCELSQNAANKGHQVCVASFRGGPLKDELINQGIKVCILGESCIDVPGFYKLILLYKAFKPDVVHSHLFRATFWCRILCYATNTPLVTSIHGSETGWFHFLEKLTFRMSQHFIFPSLYMLEWYKKNIKAIDNLDIIYPGAHIQNDQTSIKSSNQIVIGTLSRLHPVKGIDLLLNACFILKNRGHDFRLSIAGDGPDKDRLFKMCKHLGLTEQTIFYGQIRDSKSFLDKIDIFVAPSIKEAFGIHVCEAMERGLAVVGSDTGGIPELIQDNVNGLLFESKNYLQLVDRLERLICDSDFRKSVAFKAKKAIINKFDRSSLLNRQINIYQQLLNLQKKKIHFAISSNHYGGGERIAFEIIKYMKSVGWCVSVTCSGKELSNRLKKLGIKVSSVSQKCGGIFFGLKLMLDVFVNKPAIISSHLNRAALTAGIVGKLAKVRVISHIHGLDKKGYYCLSYHLVAVSNEVKNYLISQNLSEKTISVLPNTISRVAKSCRYLEKKELRIIIAASLYKNKGHKWALEALSFYKDRIPAIKIDIIGTGPEKNSLRKLCSNNALADRVFFHGFVSNTDKYYQKADVALLPSFKEGRPLFLLEAMSWGLPCIATASGGNPSLVKQGVNGYLIKPGNSLDMVEALNKISDPDTYKRMSHNSITLFKKVNSHQHMLKCFEQIILNNV